MYEEKVCCITGHKIIRKQCLHTIKKELRTHILQAIADGYTYFICGLSGGIELYAAQIICALKKDYEIVLEIAILYPSQLYTKSNIAQHTLQQCDVIHFYACRYTMGSIMQGKMAMLQNSDMLFAVYDEKQHEHTHFMIRYATVHEKEVRGLYL